MAQTSGWQVVTLYAGAASDGSVLGTWTGAMNASGVLVARGRIYVTGATLSPVPTGQLYSMIPACRQEPSPF